MSFEIILLALGVLFFWLLLVTFFSWRVYRHYNKLTKGISEKSLKSVLEGLLKQTDLSKKEIEDLKEYTKNLEKEGLFHIQKVGLIRFNPFKDTGEIKVLFYL